MMKDDARLAPVALNGALRDSPHARDLREREAAEEMQIDELRQGRVEGGQLVERQSQRVELGRNGARSLFRAVEREELELASPFRGRLAAGVIDDETAHGA